MDRDRESADVGSGRDRAGADVNKENDRHGDRKVCK